MKRAFLLIISIALFLSLTITVSAKTDNPNANDNAQIPEQSGDYAVPGRADLRVRVFVHKQNARKVKPTPTPAPATCYDAHENIATVSPAGWTLPASMQYKVNEASAPSSVRSGVLSFVMDDFDKWTNAIDNINSRPDLHYDGPTSKTRYKLDDENIIAWGRTLPTTLGVTYIWYNPNTYEAVEIDTIMNSKVSWTLYCNSSYNAENIMIHELGHWYGLGDEYDGGYADDTMYGYGSKAETKKITPEIGDTTRLNLLYQ